MGVYKQRDKWLVEVNWKHTDGRMERIRVTSPVNTRKGAEQHERDVRLALQNGTFSRTPPKPSKTVSQLREEYFKVASREWKPATLHRHEQVWRDHIDALVGDTPIDALDVEDIDDIKAPLFEKGRKPKTINNTLSLLRGALAFAQDRGYIDRVPKIKWVKLNDTGFDFLQFSEADKLIESAYKDDQRVWGPFTTIALNSGCRLGELRCLRGHDFDLVNRILHVTRSIWRDHEGTTKTGKHRRIPLNAACMAALRELGVENNDSLLFTLGGEIITERKAKLALYRICDRAGLRRLGWHAAGRHTFASHLAMRGASLQAIQQLLGHATIRQTMVYAHLSPTFLADTVTLLDAPKAAE